MINWIYFAIIAQVIWAFCSVIDKVVISKGFIKSPFVYAVLNGAMNVLLIFLLPFVGFEPLKITDFIIALFAGIAISASVIFYYKAVNYDEISRIKIMFQIEPVLTLLFSFLFLGDFLTKGQLAGFLFLIAGGLVVSYKPGNARFSLSKAFYYILLSLLLSSLYFVSAKYIFSVTSFWSGFLWLRLTSSSAILVLFAPATRKDFVETFRIIPNKIRGLLGFKMIIDFSAFIFSNLAILYGPIALVTAVNDSISPFLVFLIATFISIYLPKTLKEEISKKAILTKLSALVFIIIGIIFVIV